MRSRAILFVALVLVAVPVLAAEAPRPRPRARRLHRTAAAPAERTPLEQLDRVRPY
jgi:hypothetical protein